MQPSTSTLYCTQTTAFFLFLLIGSLFIFAGCTQVYKILGFTEEQIDEQVSEDQETIIRTVTIVRTTAADLITTIVAGLGTVASGFLVKWLGTEREIVKALIVGIEKSSADNVKETVHKKATDAGIQSQLSKRVAAYT